MDLTALAADVLDQTRRQGATAGDVVIASGESFSAGIRLGKVEKIQNSQEKRMGLRLFAGQSSAITSTANFTQAALQAFVTETLALAKATAADPFSGLPDQSDLAQDVPDLDLTDTGVSLTLEEKLARAQEAEEAAFASDSRITNSEGAEFANASRETVYANSLGFCGSYHTTSFSLSVVSGRFPRWRDAARLLVFIATQTQGY